MAVIRAGRRFKPAQPFGPLVLLSPGKKIRRIDHLDSRQRPASKEMQYRRCFLPPSTALPVAIWQGLFYRKTWGLGLERGKCIREAFCLTTVKDRDPAQD